MFYPQLLAICGGEVQKRIYLPLHYYDKGLEGPLIKSIWDN